MDQTRINEQERTAEFSVSSETPVERWFGFEILDHSPEAIDLSRFKDGAAHRDTHYGDQIGIIEDCWIDQQQRKLRERVRYSKSARGNEIFQDVLDGIRRNVSIRYEIHELILEKEVEGVSYYRVTKWTPIHSSEEADGADPTVGHGRSEDHPEDIIPLNLDGNKSIEDQINDFNNRNENKLKIIITNNRSSKMTPEEKAALEAENQRKLAEAVKDAEKKAALRVADIYKIADDFAANLPGVKLREEASRYVAENKSVEEFRQFVMSKFKEPDALRTPVTNVGLNENEKRNFSLRNAILAMVEGRVDKLGVEFEASKTIADKLGRAQGKSNLFIPFEIQNRQIDISSLPAQLRDLVVGTPASGGYTVQYQYIPQSFIEILNNAMALQQAGVTRIDGLQGNIPMTREASSNIFYMVAESNGPTQSDVTFAQTIATPKTGGVLTKMSHKFLLQNSIGGEAYVNRKLGIAAALGVDYQGIYGSGATNNVRGLKNWSGIGGEVGAGFTRAKAINMLTQVKQANALTLGEFKWLANALTSSYLLNKEISPNTAKFLLDEVSGKMINHNMIESEQLVDGDLFGGIWSAMMLMFWNVVEIRANEFGTGFAAGDVEVRALVDFDTFVEYPGAFSLAENVN